MYVYGMEWNYKLSNLSINHFLEVDVPTDLPKLSFVNMKSVGWLKNELCYITGLFTAKPPELTDDLRWLKMATIFSILATKHF